ncbi:MAG: HD domain-containing protein [Planctomycetes bacterium]|nr:HD domain-containing protein [Planctomycetota bacterium]
MPPTDLAAVLQFVRDAERLKNVLRSAHTSTGRRESTAEHTWRLCLLAMVLEQRLEGLDFARVLKLCIVHDLGEALNGDVPAVEQHSDPHKSQRERRDLVQLLAPLAPRQRDEFVALWDDYEHARTAEACAVKVLDKLETILQHNQGANPPEFDYLFNLDYGRKHTSAAPLFDELRALLDAETRERAIASGQLARDPRTH